MRYRVSGLGRAVGAIGITHDFAVVVEAESVEDAKLKSYDHFEHQAGPHQSQTRVSKVAEDTTLGPIA